MKTVLAPSSLNDALLKKGPLNKDRAMDDSKEPADKPRKNAGCEASDQELAQIRDALRGLRYGAVHAVVQDGVIVQIERIERRRIRNGH